MVSIMQKKRTNTLERTDTKYCDCCGSYANYKIEMDDESPLYLCFKCSNKWSKMGNTTYKENNDE